MNSPSEVVITGLGVVSPIGIGKDAFWASLINGSSGVRTLTNFDASMMPVGYGAEIRDFDPKKYVKPRKSLKVMCREIQTGVAAAAMAVSDARLDVGQTDSDRVGVIFGSQLFYGDAHEYADLYTHCVSDGEFNYEQFGTQFTQRMYPLWMLKYLPNMTACHVAIAHDARGPNNSIVLGEASSLLAIIEAANVIRRGAADVMISGGSGTRISMTGWLYRGDIDLSHRTDDPTQASRPFDHGRDGMVNGEGAGTIVLEDREHAERRGANILAQIVGHGSTIDVGNSLESRQLAIENSIRQALKSSGVSPDEIDHVNAHGLSTIKNDIAEAKAIRNVLGDTRVMAPKSYFGNLGAGGGTVELVASVDGFCHREIPGTLNFEVADDNCPVNVIPAGLVPQVKNFALSLNQSGTGQCVALAIKSGVGS